ncbi:single-strand DNA endonuclease ASTE1-like [Polymixia lowei]
MGIQGLTRLITSNSEIYEHFQFSKSRLVVDGSNLFCTLYYGSDLDLRYGGEYDAFEDRIGKFVKALKDCEIEPYVVLDGWSTYSGRIRKTPRKESRIKNAHDTAMGLDVRRSTLPVLVMLMFKQTLVKLNVPFVQCFEKADGQIASLANEWKCPVLSKDSDFYIFDLPAGLLPISYFQWTTVSHNGTESYISCKRYNASSFCALFKIERQLLPIFAALAVNANNANNAKLTNMVWSINPPWDRSRIFSLKGLLRWLSVFEQPRDVLKKLQELFGDGETTNEALKDLQMDMEEYQLPPSYLQDFFTDKTVPPLPQEAHVPIEMSLAVAQGQMSSYILDILVLKRMSLSAAVDIADLPSANLTSRPIRQVMYGLLLRGSEDRVEEIDREGLQVHCPMVQPVHPDVAQQLVLDSRRWCEEPDSVRLQVYLEALGVSEATLSKVPPHLRLPVAVTCYWLQQATPTPEPPVIQALLLGLVDGETRREEGLPVQQMELTLELDHAVGHAYNQWQASLRDAVHLNQLLRFPLPEPHIAWLYRGTLVHQLVITLKKGADPEPFLVNGTSSRPLYQDLQDAVLQYWPQDTTTSRRPGGGGGGGGVETQ